MQNSDCMVSAKSRKKTLASIHKIQVWSLQKLKPIDQSGPAPSCKIAL
jgi:hypothetical protein